MTMPTPLPYGLRNVKITPYTDAAATTLAGASIALPNSRIFSFTETEEFQQLRGDDGLVAIHGNGPIVNWSLEAGGYNFEAIQAIYGGTLTTSGSAPNRIKRLRKLKTDARPYFKVEGQIMSDSGGDFHAVVFKCKASDDFSGEFGDGEFFLSSCGGQGLPSSEATTLGAVWDMIQNEQITNIP